MTREEVEEAVAEIRPAIQADGGDLELVDVDLESGLVRIAMLGACVGCPMASITLRHGIETFLKSRLPEITMIEAVEGEGGGPELANYPPPPWM